MRAHGRTVVLLAIGLFCIFAYLKAPQLIMGSQTILQETSEAMYTPIFLHEASKEVQVLTVSKEVEDAFFDSSFTNSDSTAASATPPPLVAAAVDGAPSTAARRKPTMLAVIARFHEEVQWLTDPNTGIMDNSSGAPAFVMPLEIYQAADVGPDGYPAFPGLPSFNSSSNTTNLTKNSTAKPPAQQPTWPEAWAWAWALKKNETRKKAPPGSVKEAELLARARIGFPETAPNTTEGWRRLERLSGWADTTQINASSPETLQKRARLAFQAAIAKNRSAEVLVPEVSPVLPLRIIPNRGAEAMAYLTAIIDHYDDLPDLMIFMHAHRLAWHSLLGQDWTLRRLASHPPADPELSSTNGYHALGCLERWRNDISQVFPRSIDANWRSNNGARWHEVVAGRFAQAWREHLGAAYEGLPLPHRVRVPTAATFIATKTAIQRRPKAFWVGLRDWMMRTTLSNKWLGIVMEFNWGIALANTTHFSVSQERCMCELYGVCTAPAEI